MSVQATGWVLDHSTARFAARLVLLSIANHAKADGTGAWPSYETIAKEAGITRRHAYRLMADLETSGEIIVDRNGGPKGANLYTLAGMARDNMSPDISGSPVTTAEVGTNPAPARDKSSTKDARNVPRTIIEPPESQPSQEPSSSVALARPDVETLCALLADLIEANTAKRPTITSRWREEARLLLDRDRREPAFVEAVMRWATADSFWRSNILGMPKFREKFEQLALRTEAALRTNGRPPSLTERMLAKADELEREDAEAGR